MSRFYDAFTTADAHTFNGALTNSTTGNKVLDLFSTVGSLRGKKEELEYLFTDAVAQDIDLATRCMLWARDAREGAGERSSGRIMLRSLAEDTDMGTEDVFKLLRKIVQVGRWDDLFSVFGTDWEKCALDMIHHALVNHDALCAKWMPRNGKEHADLIRKYLGLSPKHYRQTLSGMSFTVEQNMCSRNWGDIKYQHVPSQANLKYVKAFLRHDEDRYRKYLDSVTKGEVKMNASVAYPYEVLRKIDSGNADQMWKSLPNYMEGNEERVLPMVDVSNSMRRGSTNPLPIDVAVGLGLYISERNEGPFKDEVMTFSARPQMHKVKGHNLKTRMNFVRHMEWGMNTNLGAAFETLLKRAVQGNVDPKDMPTMILILSDMEFDSSCTLCTTYDVVRENYERNGYEVPKIVFWNLYARLGNNPVKQRDKNTALVSGFSPSILKSVLSGKQFDPTSLMMDTLMKPRYSWR